MSLKRKTQTALIWDLSGSMGRQIAAFAISILLARLLSPEEYGIVAMAMIFIQLTNVFIDVGFTDGIVQSKNISNLALTSLFYVNFSFSILLSMLIILIAPFIGEFYENNQITDVLYYLVIVPPIAALGKVHSAILMRNLNFKALNIRTIAATIIGGAVGVISAINGQGVYSLVWQQIIFTITDTILLWVGSKWKPIFAFSFNEIRSVLNFSQYVFFDQLLRQVFNKINTLFVGKVFSPIGLGVYSRAESLNSLVSEYTSNSLRNVMYPVLSSVQDDSFRFSQIFFRASSLSSAVATILTGTLYFLSETIIIGLLGEKWRGSVNIFKILAFVMLVAPHIGLISKAILSKGLSKVKFNMGLIQRILLLSPLPLGFFYGIELFTVGITVSKYLILFAFILYAHRDLGFSISQQFKTIFTPIYPLIILIVFFYILPFQTPEILRVITFLIIETIYLLIVKHELIGLFMGMLRTRKIGFN